MVGWSAYWKTRGVEELDEGTWSSMQPEIRTAWAAVADSQPMGDGKAAYQAYWLSRVKGVPRGGWEDLDEETQRAWTAVAKAVTGGDENEQLHVVGEAGTAATFPKR